jgi:hypothetical protein
LTNGITAGLFGSVETLENSMRFDSKGAPDKRIIKRLKAHDFPRPMRSVPKPVPSKTLLACPGCTIFIVCENDLHFCSANSINSIAASGHPVAHDGMG